MKSENRISRKINTKFEEEKESTESALKDPQVPGTDTIQSMFLIMGR